MSLLKPYTNNDMLNDMSTDEKAAFINDNSCCTCCVYLQANNDECNCPDDKDCKDGIKQWLEQKAERKE